MKPPHSTVIPAKAGIFFPNHERRMGRAQRNPSSHATIFTKATKPESFHAVMPANAGIHDFLRDTRKMLIDKKRLLSVMTLLAFMAVLFATSPANAEDTGTSFADQCPVLFAQADSFANSCLANAQPFKRYFNDEPEYHSAYLGSAAPGSHFALGCALNEKHEIAFLGIYYSLNNNDFKIANSAPFAAVDFNGNIAVILNGQLVNFLAVRPFQTKTIPLLYYAQGPKNCEKSDLPPGETEDNAGNKYFVTEWRVGTNVWIRDCSSTPTTCLPDAEFLEVVKGEHSEGFFAPTVGSYLTYFIEPGGGFLISKPVLQKYCPYYYAPKMSGKVLVTGSVDVIQQVCQSKENSLNLTP